MLRPAFNHRGEDVRRSRRPPSASGYYVPINTTSLTRLQKLATLVTRDELEHMNEPKRGAAVLTFGSAYAARLAIEKSGQRLGGGALIEVRASVRRKGAL